MTRQNFSRRNFVGGAAAALGTLALTPEVSFAREVARAKGIRRVPGGLLSSATFSLRWMSTTRSLTCRRTRTRSDHLKRPWRR